AGTPPADLAPIASSNQPSPQVLANLAELGLESVDVPDLETPLRREGATYQGPAPAFLAESERPLDQSSPERALRGALDALARQDLAALARLRRSPRSHPRLTEDDGADARRRFLSPSMAPTWKRIGAALQAGAFQVVTSSPGKAVVVVQVGGALGTYRISLHKDGDAWFMS
ncbi:MAG: hypothetical protein JKY65_34495, partial [Planctomycetes bacterium]|nr:hypothetical protein [Planctomycetota bacterium]